MILVDTGPIVAVANDRDDRHRECKYLLERLAGPLLIPATVATLDRRDFGIVHPAHVPALTLLP